MPSWLTKLIGPLKWALVTAVVVAAGSIFIPNRYASVGRILPADGRSLSSGLGGLAATAATFGISIPGSEGADANFVDILQSRWMSERLLLTRFSFRARSWRFGREVEKDMTLYDFLDSKNIDRAVVRFGKVLSCSKDAKSKVVTIRVETKSPSLSQAVLQQSVKLLEQFVQEKGRTKGGAKALFAEGRLGEARKEMDATEGEFRRFLDANRNYLVSSDPAIRLRGLRLEAEYKLRQQIVTTLALSREQALMEEKNDIPVINVLDPGNLPIEKAGPNRAGFVVGAFLASLALLVAWQFRATLREMLAVQP